MIKQDMKFTLLGLSDLLKSQEKELNMAIIKERTKAAASSKNKLKMASTYNAIQGRFECIGYIALKCERFFIYRSSITFIPVSEVIDGERLTIFDRKILYESTTEVLLDVWLDQINK